MLSNFDLAAKERERRINANMANPGMPGQPSLAPTWTPDTGYNANEQYTGTANDITQQAQHAYLGPDWAQFFASLAGTRVNFGNVGNPVADAKGR
jgi:hypothetical protein